MQDVVCSHISCEGYLTILILFKIGAVVFFQNLDYYANNANSANKSEIMIGFTSFY